MALPNSFISNQEMPPPGGFGEIKIARGNPVRRGPPGWALFLGTGLIISYGYYQLGQSNIERRNLRKEKREMRVAILPFLQAESDVLFLRQEAQVLAQERNIMQDIPGWNVGESVYHSDRWVSPNTCTSRWEMLTSFLK